MTQRYYTKRLEQRVDVAHSLAASRDFESLFATILEATCELTNSAASGIILYDQDTESLEMKATTWSLRESPAERPVDPEKSLAGEVYRTGMPVNYSETNTPGSTYDELALEPGFRIQSILSVPLSMGTRNIGVLQVFNKIGATEFSHADVDTLMDLAEQASIALENARMFSVLEETDRLLAAADRTRSDFLAIASHELRTPVQHIISQASLMRDTTDENLVSQLDSLLAYAERLNRVVGDMVDLSDLDSGQIALSLEEFSISEFVDELESDYQQRAAEKQVTLQVSRPQANETMRADRNKIRMVLGHILDNGIKFSPRDDVVMVKVESEFDQIRFSVSNNGPEIPREKIPHIFDRFYQVDEPLTRRHDGLGLGLPIAHNIVELHGGSIWAESLAGRGTHFTFVLPRNAEEQPAPFLDQPEMTAALPAESEQTDQGAHLDLEVDERIHDLLKDVGRVLPEMLPTMSHLDAQRQLARYAMRHSEESFLLSDYSLVRTGENPTEKDAATTAAPIKPPSQSVSQLGEFSTQGSQRDIFPKGPVSMQDSEKFITLPPRVNKDSDEENEGDERRRLTIALVALIVTSLAACILSLLAINSPTGRELVEQVVATDAATVAPEASAEALVVPTTAQTDVAAAPTAVQSPTEAAALPQTEPSVVLNISELTPDNGYSKCTQLDNSAGEALGEACMAIATSYVDDDNQLLAVEGRPAIIGIWFQLSALNGAGTHLVGLTSDPDSDLLPEGEWVRAVTGTVLNLDMGSWAVIATVGETKTIPFPSTPDTAPVLVGLSVDFVVTTSSN